MEKEKDYHFTGYNKKLCDTARMLRKNMTKQECQLWHNYLKFVFTVAAATRDRPVHC